MLCKTFTFVVVLVTCCVLGTWGQPCIPEPVETVELANDTLSWSESNNCEETQYVIVIQSSGIIEYEYTVDSLSLDVSFLRLCRAYIFTVTATANHILGLETSLEATIALADGVDIGIQNFTGVQIGDDVLIQWEVDETYSSCVSYYHILSYDEDSETPDSVYIGQNGYLVEHVAQCMNYLFEITAYYNNGNGTTAQFNFTVPDKPNNPTLVELRQNTVEFNTTWSLEKFSVNRCEVTALYVNGTHFNQTYVIEDSPDRPDVLVTVNGLRSDIMYYFTVYTENSAGLSDPYQLAVQTLEINPTID